MLTSAKFTSCVGSSKFMFVCSSFHLQFVLCYFLKIFVHPVECLHGRVWELTTGSTPLDEQQNPLFGYCFSVRYHYCILDWCWNHVWLQSHHLMKTLLSAQMLFCLHQHVQIDNILVRKKKIILNMKLACFAVRITSSEIIF